MLVLLYQLIYRIDSDISKTNLFYSCLKRYGIPVSGVTGYGLHCCSCIPNSREWKYFSTSCTARLLCNGVWNASNRRTTDGVASV